MKHTKEYLDSKYVSGNPDKYDMRDVIEARKYIRAYEDGMKLSSDGVSADVTHRKCKGCGNIIPDHSCEDYCDKDCWWRVL
jgi:hypothetical protein